MNKVLLFRFYPQNNIFVMLGFLLCTYFVFHSLHGQRSYPALLSVEKSIQSEQAKLHALQEQKKSLEKRVVMLRPDSLHRDYLEERVRLVLGYQDAQEVHILQQ